MRSRQKFCDLSITLRSELFDVLSRGAELHGQQWHVAYRLIEDQLRAAAVREAERLIVAYATPPEPPGGDDG